MRISDWSSDVCSSDLVHPVIWIGRLIGLVDRQWNRGRARRSRGIAAMALVVGVAMLAGLAIEWGLPDGLWGAAALVFIATTALAQRSLDMHVGEVARALGEDGEIGRAHV